MGAKLVAHAGRGVMPGFGRFRLGTKNACGLVSRCGHQGLPLTNIARRDSRNPGPQSPRMFHKISLTEPFGQYIFSRAANLGRRFLSKRCRNPDLSREAKPM